jgi:hypothetical protein
MKKPNVKVELKKGKPVDDDSKGPDSQDRAETGRNAILERLAQRAKN